jgi:hypothetical protein
MPSKSLAQDRFVRAKAAEGVAWAKRWIEDEHGMKIPHIQHVRRAKRKTKRAYRHKGY